MQMTITIDDELIERAHEVTGMKDRSAVIQQALTQMIQRDAAMKLIALGGSDPNATAPPRRRWNDDGSFGNPE